MSENRAGYIYILKAHPPFESCYKIGRTKYPDARIKAFGVKLPFEVDVLMMAKTNDCFELERLLHNLYDARRQGGEWFKLCEGDIEWVRRHMLVQQADHLICLLADEIGRLGALLETNTADRLLDRILRASKALHNAAKRYERRDASIGAHMNGEEQG